MSEDTIFEIFSKLFKLYEGEKQLSVSWHCGEPLVLPIQFYGRCFDIIEELSPKELKVNHNFQTNGLLINKDWIDFFTKTNSIIGVSIDGPEKFNDTNRVDRKGIGIFKEALRGLRLLRDYSIPFYVICVLNRTSMKHADELFDFFSKEEVRDICFNIEEVIGENQSSDVDVSEASITRFSKFLCVYYEKLISDGAKQWVREFDVMMRTIVSANLEAPTNALTTPWRTISVDWEGNFSTFSPELLTATHAKYSTFRFGNVHHHDFTDVFENSDFRRINASISKGVDSCKTECEYFGVCGGGSPANKLFELGDFAGTETIYCKLKVKTLTEFCLRAIESGTSLHRSNSLSNDAPSESATSLDSIALPTYLR